MTESKRYFASLRSDKALSAALQTVNAIVRLPVSPLLFQDAYEHCESNHHDRYRDYESDDMDQYPESDDSNNINTRSHGQFNAARMSSDTDDSDCTTRSTDNRFYRSTTCGCLYIVVRETMQEFCQILKGERTPRVGPRSRSSSFIYNSNGRWPWHMYVQSPRGWGKSHAFLYASVCLQQDPKNRVLYVPSCSELSFRKFIKYLTHTFAEDEAFVRTILEFQKPRQKCCCPSRFGEIDHEYTCQSQGESSIRQLCDRIRHYCEYHGFEFYGLFDQYETLLPDTIWRSGEAKFPATLPLILASAFGALECTIVMSASADHSSYFKVSEVRRSFTVLNLGGLLEADDSHSDLPVNLNINAPVSAHVLPLAIAPVAPGPDDDNNKSSHRHAYTIFEATPAAGGEVLAFWSLANEINREQTLLQSTSDSTSIETLLSPSPSGAISESDPVSCATSMPKFSISDSATLHSRGRRHRRRRRRRR